MSTVYLQSFEISWVRLQKQRYKKTINAEQLTRDSAIARHVTSEYFKANLKYDNNDHFSGQYLENRYSNFY
jgi:hypothetical protein